MVDSNGGIDFLGKACWWLRRSSMLIVKAKKPKLDESS